MKKEDDDWFTWGNGRIPTMWNDSDSYMAAKLHTESIRVVLGQLLSQNLKLQNHAKIKPSWIESESVSKLASTVEVAMHCCLNQTETSSEAIYTVLSMCSWHNSTGKLIHSRGPATEKSLKLVTRHVLVCGTIGPVSKQRLFIHDLLFIDHFSVSGNIHHC